MYRFPSECKSCKGIHIRSMGQILYWISQIGRVNNINIDMMLRYNNVIIIEVDWKMVEYYLQRNLEVVLQFISIPIDPID
jgi:hypothetical protein